MTIYGIERERVGSGRDWVGRNLGKTYIQKAVLIFFKCLLNFYFKFGDRKSGLGAA